MYVCVCRSVTDSQVQRAIAQGANTREAVGRQCGAGTDCGGCHDELDDLISAANSATTQGHCKARVTTSELSLSASPNT